VSLSESACLRRVRALEESGSSRLHRADRSAPGGLPGECVREHHPGSAEPGGLEAFESAVRKVPEVMECYLMTGEHDYLLRLVVADMADFERIHNQHLTRLPSVARVHSSFAMRTVTRATSLPVR